MALIAAADPPFPTPYNTQETKIPLTPAKEAVKWLKLPNGFKATLFASEPDVQQPISMTLDDRGRLWVAECYTYGEREVNYDLKLRDRVIILEDTNYDGRADKRKVFWDQGQRLTSVEVGFGGVWVLCAPQLLFIPDKDRDDVPDGPPVVHLDGFDAGPVRHNIVNGLRWGPDGWLYGRHGIQATSAVGTPGTPPEQRRRLNCSIWRYHPTRHVFEVVCEGTTNPWGFDYDEYGQMFFSNTVIGHFWHVIPGAHYKRMYGEDLNPHVYELIDQHADHYHWDTGKQWHETREPTGLTDKLGGGHAHSGLMIYLGDNWPAEYRGSAFMVNLHGRRLNRDKIDRCGSGYIARHARDFLTSGDAWFRGIDMIYGPDGGVYLADWCDIGECHENDGVHRTSGRIYRISHRDRRQEFTRIRIDERPEPVVVWYHERSRFPNEYYVRTARRILQERAAAGEDVTWVHKKLHDLLRNDVEIPTRLRALWTLHVTNGISVTQLRQLLGDPNEHVRAWSVRLLLDHSSPEQATVSELVATAREEHSGLVRLFLASALQRLPIEQRVELAKALLVHDEDQVDHNLPLMLWYGIEPLAPAYPEKAVELACVSKIPKVRRFIVRRLTEDIEKNPGPLNRLLERCVESESAAFTDDVLQGMTAGLRGWHKATPPKAWSAVYEKVKDSPFELIRNRARELAVVFGDGRAMDELRKIAVDAKADGDARRAALKALIDTKTEGLLPLLKGLIADRATVGIAARGLAAFDDPNTPRLILQHYQTLQPHDRPDAIQTLASRPLYAAALLDAVEKGRLPRTEISAHHARQIRSFNDDALTRKLSQVWGEVRTTPEEKKQLMARYKSLLTAERLKSADLSRGRALFNKTCASCHKLFGEGSTISADLTGSNRMNLEYLLENVVDPSAIVPAEFRMSVIALKDGRTLTGVLQSPTERTVTVQTPTEKLVLQREHIEATRDTVLSLMPDGLLAPLDDGQVCDLIAYLMSPRQVELPGDASPKRR